MTIYDIPRWKQDLDAALSVLPELDAAAGKSILITGAAGLICSSVVDLIFRYNDTHENPIHIRAAGRWPEEMTARFGALTERPDFSFVLYDAAKPHNELSVHADYLIHGASNAFPALIVKEPVETMLSNFSGLKDLLDYAKHTGAARLLYISSSEVYGKKENDLPFRENEYGFIDLLDPRSSYSVGKRAAETLCASYSQEYGVETLIVRPGHIYGPTASAHDNRVSSAWAYSAARGEPIVMKSDGSQLRSYCYCLDCASAILKVLLSGENRRAYNISNPESVISIRQLAEKLAEHSGVQIRMDLPTESEKRGFNPMKNSSLAADSLLALGWRGMFSADVGLKHSVEILKALLDT